MGLDKYGTRIFISGHDSLPPPQGRSERKYSFFTEGSSERFLDPLGDKGVFMNVSSTRHDLSRTPFGGGRNVFSENVGIFMFRGLRSPEWEYPLVYYRRSRGEGTLPDRTQPTTGRLTTELPSS